MSAGERRPYDVRFVLIAILSCVLLALWWLSLDGAVNSYERDAGGVTLGQGPDAATEVDVDPIDATVSDNISQTSCALAEIRLSSKGKSIEQAPEPLRAKLSKPPFTEFDRFEHVRQGLPGESLMASNGSQYQFWLREVSGSRLTIEMFGQDADGVQIVQFKLKTDVGNPVLIGSDVTDGYVTVVWLDCSTKIQ